MVELAHQFDFVDKGFFPFVLTISCFLRKCLYGELSIILQSDCQVHTRKVTLPDFLYGFEEFMEAPLVDLSSKLVTPFLYLD